MNTPLAVNFLSFAKIGMRFQASVWIAILFLVPAAPIAWGADIISNGPVSILKGSDAINPRPGTQGGGGQFNSLFYVRPGEGESPLAGHPQQHQLPNQPFSIAYEPTALPVQSNDWWTGVGLQWYVAQIDAGWAGSYDSGVILSRGFISEPFYSQFVDFTGQNGSVQPPLQPPHGLRLWNQNAIAVKTDGVISIPTPTPSGSPTPTPTRARFDAANNLVDRAFLAPQVQAVVTVGLEGVHPIGTTKPTGPPWTNVRVRQYSDWGVVLAYKDGANEMEITMANGSPCTWFERTLGQANFLVWVGGSAAGGDAPTVWQNQNGVLGVTVSSPFNPDNGISTTVSKAAYLVIADQGTWERTDADNGKQSMFRNSTATRVVVLAMPHNIRFDTISLQRAANDLKPFACRKIVDSRIDYPPIPGSETSVNINGQTVTLGYSPTDHRVALQLRVETQPFLPGTCTETAQLLFPHHFKSLQPDQRAQVDGRYTWNSIMGLLRLYKSSSFVQLIDTKGFLPFFPDEAVESDLRNPLPPSQMALDDIYETMRNWFYKEEFQTGGNHIDSFLRNIGTYDNQQFNTYEQGLSTLIESIMIADQLAHATKLTGNDTSTNNLHACLCKPKTQVAAEMRDYILQALKELVGQWADVYTAQFIQHNPQFNTTYGFPAGFGSVQNLNDHHFHFGYFLRAAAAIGRYDRAWLDAYLPFVEELRKDVANYDRNDTNYPFLRNFSPFYGHNWADGTSQDGANQESTSEAINFSAGLMELGLLLGNNEWRDMGMYMYEQEILAAEQYWFNQDATLGNIIPRPPTDPNDVRYNGNWPEQFVTYKGPDNGVWHTTLGGIVGQRFVKRETFFGGIAATYFIHLIPMSANTLYAGRNQDWLQATWKQYLLDTGAQGNPNFQSADEVFIAALQARMPTSGQGLNGTGLTAALTRIAREHAFQFYGTNTMAKYWAYTNALLGQVDTAIVADIPAYGAFKETGTQVSRLVAYNPTNQSITVRFTQRATGNAVDTFSVPAQSIVARSGGRTTSTFKPSQITTSASRLYLGPTTGPTPLPMIGQLSSTPGTWLPPDGTFPFPRLSTDISRIMPSLSIVPVATGNCSDLDLPGGPNCMNSNKAYAEWTGTFKGNLVGSKPFTQMTVYTDPALHIGWQQDPNIRANSHVRVEYFFDSTNQDPDRVEVYTLPSVNGNTFVMLQNKFTPYYFGCYSDKTNFGACNSLSSGLYGPDNPALSPGKIALDDRFAPAAPFPANVTCGKIKVQVYGQAGADQAIKIPVPVSVGTSPLLDRASWIQPPYDGGECPP
jgi:hypothetical protein